VVASAGTVNTGVIDPLDELAEFCAQEDLWLHVDGAYGAFGVLDPTVAAAYRGIERADSLALDPHKWLAVPNTCSCVLVRDGEALRAAFGFDTPYLALETEGGFGAAKRFDVLGIYQTRRFLAAKIFGVLLQLGRDGLRDHVARHIALARTMATMVAADADLELVATGDLTIVCFRFAPPELRGNDEHLNLLNREIVERVQTGGRVFVSATELDGRFVVRSCALHYALDETHISAIVDEVRTVGRQTLRERSDPN
jgi:glutamate/tyrosine decarboxylase-like PLP-dependent enzyme